jgi:hypothetical protein
MLQPRPATSVLTSYRSQVTAVPIANPGESRVNCVLQMRELKTSGAPGEVRTPDLVLRRHTLYPSELRARSLHPVEFPGQLAKPRFSLAASFHSTSVSAFILPCFQDTSKSNPNRNRRKRNQELALSSRAPDFSLAWRVFRFVPLFVSSATKAHSPNRFSPLLSSDRSPGHRAFPRRL